MTLEELTECFERHDGEYGKFERIEKPAHRRPDICAFIMLDAAVVKTCHDGSFGDMVACAEHDEIWLDVMPKELAPVATDELVRDLIRCGVRFPDEGTGLAMFV